MKLEGIRVLDLSRFLPGPHLAMMMADRRRRRDQGRGPEERRSRRAPSGRPRAATTVYFRNANRGQAEPRRRSQERGGARGLHAPRRNRRRDPRDLPPRRGRPPSASATRPSAHQGAADRLCLGLRLRPIGGPNRDRPAHDLSVNALAGVASLSVDGDGKPAMACLPPSDMGGSLMALSGILMALLRRQSTGRGDYLDLAMFDTVVSWTAHVAGTRVSPTAARPIPARPSARQGGAGVLPALTAPSDGRYVTSRRRRDEVRGPTFWKRWGGPDLIPLGRAPAGPAQAPLHAFLEETFATADPGGMGRAWFAGRDICFAPVLDLKEAFDDPHLAAPRHGSSGDRATAPPISASRSSFGEEPGADRGGRAGSLGAAQRPHPARDRLWRLRVRRPRPRRASSAGRNSARARPSLTGAR